MESWVHPHEPGGVRLYQLVILQLAKIGRKCTIFLCSTALSLELVPLHPPLPLKL